MQAIYLTRERIYLRAMLVSDRESAAAWFPGPWPMTPSAAEEFLRESIGMPWARRHRLAIVRADGDEIIGSVALWFKELHAHVTMKLSQLAPDADELHAEAMQLLSRWISEEMVVASWVFEFPADYPRSIATAEVLGMMPAARLRQAVARPGHRVDWLFYEGINERFTHLEATGTGDDA